MANILTTVRIICAPLILIFPAFSTQFYVFYLLGGITDAIDGTVARKLGKATAWGAKYDSAADILFALAALIRIIGSVDFPLWLLLWIGTIAFIKAANMIAAFSGIIGSPQCIPCGIKFAGSRYFFPRCLSAPNVHGRQRRRRPWLYASLQASPPCRNPFALPRAAVRSEKCRQTALPQTVFAMNQRQTALCAFGRPDKTAVYGTVRKEKPCIWRRSRIQGFSIYSLPSSGSRGRERRGARRKSSPPPRRRWTVPNFAEPP